MFYIYILYDPRKPGVIRYVGKTGSTLRQRLHEHIRHLKGTCHRENWIRSLLNANVRPAIKGIFCWEDPQINWQLIERNFIFEMRKLGHPLTNATDGGEGMMITPELRAKLSAIAKARPPISAETIAKIANANRGKKRPQSAIDATAAANRGRKQTPEHTAKLKGRTFSSDTRLKMSEAAKNRKIKRKRDAQGHFV